MKVLKNYAITGGGVIGLYLIMQLLIMVNILNGYYVGVIILIGINIVAASSLNLATGFLGQLALGHAGFIAIGAYVTAFTSKFLMDQLPLPQFIMLIVALIVGGLAAAFIGVLIGIPALRLRGDYLGIVTLGFGEIIRIALFNLEFTGGARGYRGIPRWVGFTEMFFIVVVVLMVLYLLIRSRHGRAILSIREDEIAAEAVGVHTTFYKVYGFAVSAFFAGVAGGALGFYQQMLDPKKFTFMYSVEMFIIVVLGGMGSFTGTVVAAVILGVLNEYLHAIGDWRLVIYALLLIIMMIFRPKGIMGTFEFSLVHVKRDFTQYVADKKEAFIHLKAKLAAIREKSNEKA